MPKHRLRIHRVTIKANGVTVLLQIVSRTRIGFYLWQLRQHGRKMKRFDVLGDLTLKQLDRLIKKLRLRFARFHAPHQLRTEVRSSSLVIHTTGDCLKCWITFVRPRSAEGDGSDITVGLTRRQLARFIANLLREYGFAVLENRRNMVDD